MAKPGTAAGTLASPVPPSLDAGPRAAAAAVLRLLAEAQTRTEELVAPLQADDYFRSHDPVLGPIAWDVGHIGQQEDLWLVQALGGRPETRAGFNVAYDAYRNPRAARASLPLLDRDEVRRFRAEVRAGTAEVLGEGPADGDARWRGHWLHHMVATHEHQHNETIIQNLAAVPDARYVPSVRKAHPAPSVGSEALQGFAFVPAGVFEMGVEPHVPCTYDNEWPRHKARTGAFWLAKAPVTNGDFLRFVEGGGYDDRALWRPDGWAFVRQEGITHPLYWVKEGSGWTIREIDLMRPLPLDSPVSNISWHEADAFARWAGHRLPTEAEWEKAATWDAEGKHKRPWPWGGSEPTPAHANLDHHHWGPDPVGSHPDGATPSGIQQLIGDVWEWTSTTFGPYPGFEAFPYHDYSERFFGAGLKVLRGGSWAARPGLRFGTFRNWDLPIRRQIFAGLRLAADAARGPDHPPSLESPQ